MSVSVHEAMPVCNHSFHGGNPILPHGVTAGPTLGLIPRIHLQRQCQPVRGEEDRGGGRGEETKEGRRGGGGGGYTCAKERVKGGGVSPHTSPLAGPLKLVPAASNACKAPLVFVDSEHTL